MFRSFAIAIVLTCLAPGAWAQTSSVERPETQKVMPAKKSAPKAKAGALPPGPTNKGPCQIGVIPAFGDKFVFRRVGLTRLGDEETEVPIDAWGLDDLAVA